MSPIITPAMMVHRVLARMDAFVSSQKSIREYLADIPIPERQTVLGIYENNKGSKIDAVVVTDTSLWLVGAKQIKEIPYLDIEPNSMTWHPESKRQADSLEIELKGKVTKFVPIRGRYADGTADVALFITFLGGTCAAARQSEQEV